MIDEIKTIKAKYKNREIELIPDWRGFLRLNSITGNAFQVLSEIEEGGEVVDDAGKVTGRERNLKWLPYIIQAMATEELTIEDIEKNILGMSRSRVTNIATVVLELLDSELYDRTEIEESSKNVEENPQEKVMES